MNKYEWNDKLSLVDEKYVEESNPLDDKVRAKGNSSSEKKRMLLTVAAAVASLTIALVIIIVNVENGKRSNPITDVTTNYEYTQTNAIGSQFETTARVPNETEAVTTSYNVVGTDNEITTAIETTTSALQTEYYDEFTYEEWKSRINYDDYIEYVDSNDNIRMTIRIYKIYDENGKSVIKNIYPIPMTVTVENIGDEDIFQITPNGCTEPEEKHHHRIWGIHPNIKDNYGNSLYDAPEWTEHTENLGLYKLSPGESFEYLYCLTAGDVYEPWIGQDKIDQVEKLGYKISFDEISVHDIYIHLYDYSYYNIEEVHFTGPIGLSYKFEDGYTTPNTDSFSIDIDIPVKIAY